jgi:predicted TIM-barrel fold metal-dependent hydrolase
VVADIRAFSILEAQDMTHKPAAIVDAHQHFWDLERNYLPWLCDFEPVTFRYGDYSSLRRSYGIADYRRDTAGWPIVRSVYVEAEWDRSDPVAETRWVSALAASAGLPSASVAWCNLAGSDAAEILTQHAAFPLVRGIRQKPTAADRPQGARRGAAGSMDDPAWRCGYAMLAEHRLSFDLQTPWWHMDAAAALARDFPETQIVINHTALPADRSADGLRGWRRALEMVAAEPNVAIKISGLGQRDAAWTVEANGPIVRDAIGIFGVERAMFASNYPVDRLAGSFDTIYSGFLSATADRSESDRRKLFHDNAVRFYRLDD